LAIQKPFLNEEITRKIFAFKNTIINQMPSECYLMLQHNQCGVNTKIPCFVIDNNIKQAIRIPIDCHELNRPLQFYYGFRSLWFFNFKFVCIIDDISAIKSIDLDKLIDSINLSDGFYGLNTDLMTFQQNKYDSPVYMISRNIYGKFKKHHFESHIYITDAFKETMEDIYTSYKRPLCVIQVFNGLGNQLFMIATGINYCIENDCDLGFTLQIPNPRKYYWDTILRFYKGFLYSGENPKFKYNDEPNDGVYMKIPFQNTDIFLRGYFPSPKYFNNILPLLKYLVEFPPKLAESLEYKYKDLFRKNTVLCHARRGDYEVFFIQFGPLTNEYYKLGKSLVDKTAENSHYVLVSDDLSFFRKSLLFTNENATYIEEDDIGTLYVMSRSQYYIMANSTFSWWGAVIGTPKLIICPKQWFGPKGPKHWEDIYMDSWVKI